MALVLGCIGMLCWGYVSGGCIASHPVRMPCWKSYIKWRGVLKRFLRRSTIWSVTCIRTQAKSRSEDV